MEPGTLMPRQRIPIANRLSVTIRQLPMANWRLGTTWGTDLANSPAWSVMMVMRSGMAGQRSFAKKMVAGNRLVKRNSLNAKVYFGEKKGHPSTLLIHILWCFVLCRKSMPISRQPYSSDWERQSGDQWEPTRTQQRLQTRISSRLSLLSRLCSAPLVSRQTSLSQRHLGGNHSSMRGTTIETNLSEVSLSLSSLHRQWLLFNRQAVGNSVSLASIRPWQAVREGYHSPVPLSGRIHNQNLARPRHISLHVEWWLVSPSTTRLYPAWAECIPRSTGWGDVSIPHTHSPYRLWKNGRLADLQWSHPWNGTGVLLPDWIQGLENTLSAHQKDLSCWQMGWKHAILQ